MTGGRESLFPGAEKLPATDEGRPRNPLTLHALTPTRSKTIPH
jgi:hypothetical protein